VIMSFITILYMDYNRLPRVDSNVVRDKHVQRTPPGAVVLFVIQAPPYTIFVNIKVQKLEGHVQSITDDYYSVA